eukprot:scaffold7294_cov93-Cylindrotheca_fusiformis.AAC.9
MSSFLQQPASFNNEGLAALMEGNGVKAISSLVMAVKTMKQLLVSEHASSLESLENSDSTALSFFEDLETVEVPVINSDESSFFRRAILLPTDADGTSALDIYLYSAAVIFNLALAHHSLAHTSNGCMAATEKMYATVLKLLDNRVGHVESAIVLKLACIHNICYIRFENGNYDQVNQGLNELNILLAKTDEMMYESPDAQGLILGVVLLRHPRVAAAAA